ncbi:MarR family winged helix-turn-helix transcriptional regulator [Undibacterium sp. JH2W]|uniref:MarR family winged helix-turn-helix transcriptional regulator n=1 Tax=Undibacterium sp. JH2W TaxID=3413037 RepID=UPI003BF0F5AD
MFFLKELPTRQMLETYQQRFPAMKIDTVEAALHMLRQASLLMRELDAYFASHDLSQLRFLILIVLDREVERKGLMPSEVAARLDVSRPVMTRTLQTLATDGLLEFMDGDTDARVKLLRLTAQGKASLYKVLPCYYAQIENFMQLQSDSPERG